MPMHQCEYCLEVFSRPHVLREHIRKHTGEKPYRCSTCGIPFARSGDLWKHQKTHGGKQYTCKKVHADGAVCGASFHRKADLVRHQKSCTASQTSAISLVPQAAGYDAPEIPLGLAAESEAPIAEVFPEARNICQFTFMDWQHNSVQSLPQGPWVRSDPEQMNSIWHSRWDIGEMPDNFIAWTTPMSSPIGLSLKPGPLLQQWQPGEVMEVGSENQFQASDVVVTNHTNWSKEEDTLEELRPSGTSDTASWFQGIGICAFQGADMPLAETVTVTAVDRQLGGYYGETGWLVMTQPRSMMNSPLCETMMDINLDINWNKCLVRVFIAVQAELARSWLVQYYTIETLVRPSADMLRVCRHFELNGNRSAALFCHLALSAGATRCALLSTGTESFNWDSAADFFWDRFESNEGYDPATAEIDIDDVAAVVTTCSSLLAATADEVTALLAATADEATALLSSGTCSRTGLLQAGLSRSTAPTLSTRMRLNWFAMLSIYNFLHACVFNSTENGTHPQRFGLCLANYRAFKRKWRKYWGIAKILTRTYKRLSSIEKDNNVDVRATLMKALLQLRKAQEYTGGFGRILNDLCSLDQK